MVTVVVVATQEMKRCTQASEAFYTLEMTRASFKSTSSGVLGSSVRRSSIGSSGGSRSRVNEHAFVKLHHPLRYLNLIFPIAFFTLLRGPKQRAFVVFQVRRVKKYLLSAFTAHQNGYSLKQGSSLHLDYIPSFQRGDGNAFRMHTLCLLKKRQMRLKCHDHNML